MQTWSLRAPAPNMWCLGHALTHLFCLSYTFLSTVCSVRCTVYTVSIGVLCRGVGVRYRVACCNYAAAMILLAVYVF